jgi:hypothetical protein
MAKLYVANCTKQKHDFLYLAPETRTPRQQRIPVGAQIQVFQDAPEEVLMAIVQQHERYGMIAAKDIPRAQAFFGYCYSIDKPINVEQIMTAVQHNEDVLVEKGLEARKIQALALDESLSEMARENENELTGLEIEIIEDTKGKPHEERTLETIEVTKPGREPRQNKRRRGGN